MGKAKFIFEKIASTSDLMLDAYTQKAEKEIYGKSKTTHIKGRKYPIVKKQQTVGFYTVGRTKKGDPTISNIYVAPQHRNKGYASEVLSKFQKRRGSLTLFTDKDNKAMQAAAAHVGLKATKKAQGSKSTVVMEKTASPKYIKMFRGGHIGEDVLKQIVMKGKLAPKEIKGLAIGSESAVSLVTHPKEGLAVQKFFDPKGKYFSDQHFSDKVEAFRILQPTKRVAKMLQVSKKHPIFIQEYMPTKTLFEETKHEMGSRSGNLAIKTSKKLNKVIKKHKMPELTDMSTVNMMMNPDNKRKPKVVDFLVTGDKPNWNTKEDTSSLPFSEVKRRASQYIRTKIREV